MGQAHHADLATFRKMRKRLEQLDRAFAGSGDTRIPAGAR